MIISDSEFVVTLIRFLGAGTLPFLFRWGNMSHLAHCDACSMQISQGAAREVPQYLMSNEIWGEARCARLYGWYSCWTCTSCTVPAKNKMAAYMLLRIGWISQRIRRYLRLFHLRQYFNGKKIRRILKLYGLFVHNMIFFFGANWSLPRFF